MVIRVQGTVVELQFGLNELSWKSFPQYRVAETGGEYAQSVFDHPLIRGTSYLGPQSMVKYSGCSFGLLVKLRIVLVSLRHLVPDRLFVTRVLIIRVPVQSIVLDKLFPVWGTSAYMLDRFSP
ncbi:hypothetical protein QJS04_geneDACA022905 [Acorus gramineus]|uniref:Uncharacterized protein n=1 Tax=Acorus gramineus TaxID=55184 RepID=A0AAV9A323_ACOGR|nr:hypothetical protein QJS04_geneDACA022905 [Acorus gramineus]